MAYSTGMLDKLITIAKPVDNMQSDFGKSGQPKYEILGTFNAAEDFNRGTKAMREGALDAYNIVMFRMRYRKKVTRWCVIKYEGSWYQITSLNSNFRSNTIQITAQEMANQNVNIVEPYYPSASVISGGSSSSHEVGQ